MTPQSITQALAEHDRWLKSLLQTLVRPDEVEDLAQETWVAALVDPPRARRPWRAWLATVARRKAHRRRREVERRVRREQRAAAPEALPGADELVEQVEFRQRLTAIVLALDEPFRSTLLQRFYERRRPQEIARACGVPPATVRSRLHRGVAQVRSALDAGPDRRLWRAAALLVGVRPDRAAVAPWIPGVFAMSTKTVVWLGAFAAACLLALPLLWPEPAVPVRGGGGAVDGAEPMRATAAAARAADTTPERSALQARPAAAPDPAAAVPLVRGRVLDPHGQPIAGARVFTRANLQPSFDGDGDDHTPFDVVGREWTPIGETDAQGAFAAAATGWLVVGPPHIALRPTMARPDLECVVVAVRAVGVGGVVTDEDGVPLAGVQITGFCERVPTFPSSLEQSARPDFLGGRSDAQGRFRLSRVAGTDAMELRFRAAEHEPTVVRAPANDRFDLSVALRKHARAGAIAVRGHVYAPDGAVVAQALVGYGDRSTRTDAGGGFALHVAEVDPREVLFAVADGFAAASVTLSAPPDQPLALRLGRLDGVLRGRIVDADDRPRPNLQVYLHDLRHLGSTAHTEIGFEVGAGDDWIGPHDVSGADGHFEIAGVRRRPWRLQLLDRRRGFVHTTEPVPTDREVTIRIPADAVFPVVRGRVVDRRGHGVAGVSVTYRVPIRMRDGQGVSTTGVRCVSAADGAFELVDVPVTTGRLLVSGDEIVPTEHRLRSPPAAEETVRVAARRRFRVFAPAAGEDAEIVVLAEDGEPMAIRCFDEHGHVWGSSWRLTGGRTEVLVVGDAAAEIVLRSGARELGRQPLALRGGVTAEIRF